MPSILNLKFKGNKSFVAFSNLNDTEALTKTWKVCTKVASFLEQGQRLENLSWRLWHLQNLMVDTDNAKSKREFKKLSKCMGDKLDKEKGRSIEELEAPDFKRTSSSDIIRQRAVEKERYREQNAKPGTIKRMQFTFSVDQPSAVVPGANLPVKKPDLKPSPEFTKRTRAAAARALLADGSGVGAGGSASSSARASGSSSASFAGNSSQHSDDMIIDDSSSSSSSSSSSHSRPSHNSHSLKFDSIFDQGFGPSALLFPAPTLTTRMNYGEGLNPSASSSTSDTFTVSRPTIELPLDEILNHVDSPPGSSFLDQFEESQQFHQSPVQHQQQLLQQVQQQQQQDVVMQSVASSSSNSSASSSVVPPAAVTATITTTTTTTTKRRTRKSSVATRDDGDSDSETHRTGSNHLLMKSTTASLSHQSLKDSMGAPSLPLLPSLTGSGSLPETVAPSKLNPFLSSASSTRTNLTTRPTLTVKTSSAGSSSSTTTRSSGPGATATSLNPSSLRSSGSSTSTSTSSTSSGAPGGVKAECSNCGATHTPLWRRGLNDELNCNACGLYCKLHKRPRPKSMRNNHGEGRGSQVAASTSGGGSAHVGGSGSGGSGSGGGGGVSVSAGGGGVSVGGGAGRGGDSGVDAVMAAQTAQCYNCHTTATPLWRKDDEGKTVCNACGLYYKLHGSARPISMKSDVIRKRSRHDARRGSNAGATTNTTTTTNANTTLNSSNIEDTPSTSPGLLSRRASPSHDPPSPTLAPDSSTTTATTLTYDYTTADHLADAFGTTQSELVGALGGPDPSSSGSLFQNTFQFQFPGPYHPDYLLQMYSSGGSSVHTGQSQSVGGGNNGSGNGVGGDGVGLNFGSPSVGVVDLSGSSPSASGVGGGLDLSHMSPRSPKRRRMSTDSASEPPSSAVSFSSFGSDGYSPTSSTTSLSSSRSPMDYPFSYGTSSNSSRNGSGGLSANGVNGGNGSGSSGGGPSGPALRGSGNTFWHPPMMPQNDEHGSSPHLGFHPPMLPPSSSNNKNMVSSSSLGGSGRDLTSDSPDANEDSPMDYLHPPMGLGGVVPDDDSLFSAYLHPPMVLQEDSPAGGSIVV